MTPQELKNSILQLAIQGRLVEQRPEEGSGEELFEQIQVEKAELLKQGKIKKERPLPEIAEEEIPFYIPESWKWVRLVDFCFDIFSGKSPKYSKNITEYRVIGQAANQQGGLDYYQLKYTIKEFWEANDEKYFLRENDVILNTLGNGTLGRSGIIDNIPFPILTDGHLFVFRSPNDVSSKYIYYNLQFKRTEIEKSANGSTNQTFLSLGSTKSWIIPLPPLAEQKRIVAKIEELMPLVDRYEEAWTKLEAFNKRFPEDMQKSLLQMAIQGKLVEQRSEEGTGEELYAQIQVEKQRLIKEGKIKKDKPLPEITDDEKPFDIPESWKWVRICDIFKTSSGTTPSKSNQSYYNSDEYNWVRTTDLNNGILTTAEIKISEKAFNECHLEVIPLESVCIAMYGGAGTIGKNALIQFETTINQSVCAIHSNGFCDMSFVHMFMKYYRPLWIKKAAGSRKDPNINQVIIKSTLFPLPPLAEQKRIVAKLEELLPLCERLK